MDTSIVAALAALGGSVIGGTASLAAAYVTQRTQGRRDRLLREQDTRERLYADFIRLAADRYADFLDHNLESPSALMDVLSLVGRIHLFSTEPVLRASEAVVSHLLECYRRPAVDPVEALAHHDDLAAPLRAFTEACRRERATVLGDL